jgi:dihydroorotate dehydrogenase
MFQQAMRSLRRVTFQTVVIIGAVELTTHIPSQGKSSQLYHSLTDDWVTPLLRQLLNPETAHHLALELAQRGFAPTYQPSTIEQRINVTSKLFNKTISNCVGLAAGFDKDGSAIQSLFAMGFGMIEIGSVTLRPQPGNPSPRMFRLVHDEAIINRYGFNSMGANAVENNIQNYLQAKEQREETKSSLLAFLKKNHLISGFMSANATDGLLGINLGKNKNTTTPLEDYQTMIRQLGPYADYLVINVSCPNIDMKGLGKSTSSLKALLKACQQERDKLSEPKPIVVKLSPDLTDEELKDICQVLIDIEIDGIILTNTTSDRPVNLLSKNRVEGGGLSGRPLQQRSTECIRKVYKWTNGSVPIIGVGGIFSGKDAYEKLAAGASLVQVYSGMIYRGPGMVSKVRHELAQIMVENGKYDLRDVIGLDHEVLSWKLRQKRRVEQNELAIVIDSFNA